MSHCLFSLDEVFTSYGIVNIVPANFEPFVRVMVHRGDNRNHVMASNGLCPTTICPYNMLASLGETVIIDNGILFNLGTF